MRPCECCSLVVSWVAVLKLGLSANLCCCDLGFGFFVLASCFEVEGLERDLGRCGITHEMYIRNV